MLKIHNTVLAAITFLTLSTTASANDKGREPCASTGTENLQVMNTDHLKTVEGLARSSSTFTVDEIVGVCNIIREYNSSEDTPKQLQYIMRVHKISNKDFFSKYIDEVICVQKNVAFAALDNEREDFMSIVEIGLDLSRPLRNLDGTYMTPLDYAFKKMNEAEDTRIKGKYRSMIFQLKKKGAKTCKELERKDCVLSV